jgi:hypothetical protein
MSKTVWEKMFEGEVATTANLRAQLAARDAEIEALRALVDRREAELVSVSIHAPDHGLLAEIAAQANELYERDAVIAEACALLRRYSEGVGSMCVCALCEDTRAFLARNRTEGR